MVRTPEPPTFAPTGVLGAAILGAAVALFPSPDTGARHVEGSAITLVSVDAALAPADLWWLGDGSHRVGRSAAQPSALAIDPHVELFGTLIIGNGADGTAANPNGGNGGLLWGNGGTGYTLAKNTYAIPTTATTAQIQTSVFGIPTRFVQITPAIATSAYATM